MSFPHRILTINCGSSSLKADLFDVCSSLTLSRIASISVSGFPGSLQGKLALPEESLELRREGQNDVRDALDLVLGPLFEKGLANSIDAIGHRVVHGGLTLSAPVQIDPAVLRQIEEASELAPIHNRPALEAIGACVRLFGEGVAMVATFDTAFFRSMPDVASTYAISREIAGELGIRRFGFHGLAHRFMSDRFVELSGLADARLVTLQLGSGCSAAAIRGGKPLDTSMGFTPLEGLVMARRSGDIDPSLPGYLAAKPGLDVNAVDRLLNEQSGLLGLSGRSADTRDLLAAELAGDARAKLALDVFCYRVRKYVGAYAAVLGGLDGLVFGGGIGENSPEIRERVCLGLDWLGLRLDQQRNRRPTGRDMLISRRTSRVQAYVVGVDEGSLIAADTLQCLASTGGG